MTDDRLHDLAARYVLGELSDDELNDLLAYLESL